MDVGGIFFLVGLIIVVVGLFALVPRNKIKRIRKKILETKRSTISDLVNFAAGWGEVSMYVEVSGTVETNKFLLTEFSKRQCVYYKSTITQYYQQYVSSRDKNGDTYRSWKNFESVIFDSTNSVAKYGINDGSGYVEIKSDTKFIIHPETVLERTINQDNLLKDYGDRSMQRISASSDEVRKISFVVKDECILRNSKLYVLGDAKFEHGKLTIMSSENEYMSKNVEKLYIISTLTENELLKHYKDTMKSMSYRGYFLIAFGSLFLLSGIFILVS